MKLINIGFGNMIASSRLIAIVSPESAPVKRTVQEARDRGMVVDGTYGRRTRAVLIMDSDHVVLSALQQENQKMRKGTLYVFTGPSGAGKGTVLSRLLSEDEKLFFSISATTRAPRPGEKDGVQYYFLTKEDFEAKIAANAFLEHAKYVDNYYGTLEAPVNEKLEEGCDVILEIEVQGAMQVHEKRPDAVMVFIAPPSFEELANRLRGRGTEDEAKVQKRLETAKGELAQQDKFDYVVVNDTVERAVNELHEILNKRR